MQLKERFSLSPVQIIVWGIILLALALKLVSIFTAPVHGDINYYLNIATNYIHHGALTPYMWRINPEANIIAGSGTGYGVLLLVYWLKIFGLNPISGSLFAYLVSVATLFVFYRVARLLWNPQAALLAVMFLAVNTAFFRNATLRMDAFAIFVYCLLLWAHLHLLLRHQKRWWLHFLLGIAVIAATEIHLLAVIYIGGITLYYGIDALKERWRLQLTPAIYYAAGLILAAGLYVLIRILPDPYAYFLIPTSCDICIPRGLETELKRYMVAFIFSPIDTVLTILAVISAVRHYQFGDRYLLLLLTGGLVTMVIFNPPPAYIQYFWHIAPVAALGFGIFIDRGLKQKRLQPVAIIAIGCCFLGVVINFGISESWHPHFDPEDPRIIYIQENIPVDTVIVSRPFYYHLLIDYTNYLSYSDGENYGIKLRNETYTDFWEREKPAVVISDTPAPQKSPALWAYMQTHNFQEVIPGLWVEPALIP